jgi:tRNA(Ser,Leu) C12 N-acetylase TAN1
MESWNLVATTAAGKYIQALRFLALFGIVKPTAYNDVVMMHIRNTSELMTMLAKEWQTQGGRLLLLKRVVPVTHTFNFGDRALFVQRARKVILNWVPRLTGHTFHVHIHRRGFKDQLSSIEEEQILTAAIIDATGKAGKRAGVSIDDPDALIAIETIGSNAGMSLWFRKDLQRYPFLHID